MIKNITIIFIILSCISVVHPNSSKADQLINACIAGDLAKVEALLAKSADVNIEDNSQRTPLMWASLYGHDKIAKLLLENGADIYHRDKNKETAFDFAEMDGDDVFNWQGKIKTMKLLLEFGADPYAEGLTYLRESAARGYWEIAKSTLEETKDKNLKNQYLIAAIIGACEGNNSILAKSLIAESSDINAKLANDNGDTALIAAAGNLELVQVILEKEGDIHIGNNDGITPFMKACSIDNPDLNAIKVLLSKGAEVNGRSKEGLTALMLAIHDDGTDLNLLDFLLENGADINAKDNKNLTALYYAYGGKNVNWDIMKYLLDKGAALDFGDSSNDTFFNEIYNSGYNEIFRKLLEYIADSSRIKSDGPTALCYATRAGYTDIVKQLLKNDVDVNARDFNGMTALMLSAIEKRIDIMTLLLNHRADTEIKDKNGQTALMLSCRYSNNDILKLLIKSGADINTTDSDGRTALMSSYNRSDNPSLEIMQLLINMGIDVNAKDNRGRTALSDFSFPDTEGDWGKITFLIEHGADVNAVDENNRTILITAYQRERFDLIPLILEKGGDAGIKDVNEDAVWELCFVDRNIEIFELIINYLEDVNLKGSADTTPLMYACSNGGNLKLVSKIIDKGADVNAVSKYGKTALMVAAENGRLETVKVLLEKSPNINAQTQKGWSALMWAAEKGHTEIVKLLINVGADINATNKKGKTALEIAKANGHSETEKTISKANALKKEFNKMDYIFWIVIILICGIIIVYRQRRRTGYRNGGGPMSPDYEFKKIYDEYHPRILRYLVKLVGLNDAEDIAQDVFDKVNRGLRGFQGNSRLSNWIYRIATNTVIDRSRSATYKHSTESVPIDDGDDLGVQHEASVQKTPSTDQIVIQKEMRDCINEHIDKLPPGYKIVIVLSELEGMSNKEIAEILDISLDNVKIRLHRARTKLREVLNEACEFYYTEQNTLACDRKQVEILNKMPK